MRVKGPRGLEGRVCEHRPSKGSPEGGPPARTEVEIRDSPLDSMYEEFRAVLSRWHSGLAAGSLT